MLKMKYIGDKKTYPVCFRRITDTIVALSGDFPVKTSGFTLSRPGKKDGWDYSGYKTIYREVEGGVQFSDNGSVYAEPETPEQIRVPEPYEPTPEELAEQEQRRKEAEAVPTNSELAAAIIELAGNISDIEDAVAELGTLIV